MFRILTFACDKWKMIFKKCWFEYLNISNSWFQDFFIVNLSKMHLPRFFHVTNSYNLLLSNLQMFTHIYLGIFKKEIMFTISLYNFLHILFLKFIQPANHYYSSHQMERCYNFAMNKTYPLYIYPNKISLNRLFVIFH